MGMHVGESLSSTLSIGAQRLAFFSAIPLGLVKSGVPSWVPSYTSSFRPSRTQGWLDGAPNLSSLKAEMFLPPPTPDPTWARGWLLPTTSQAPAGSNICTGNGSWLAPRRPCSRAAEGRAQFLGLIAAPKVCRANCTTLPGTLREAWMCSHGSAIYI